MASRSKEGQTLLAVIFGGAVLIAAVLALAVVIDGFVAMTLWNWFAVPLFGLPTLGFWAAAGLAILINWFTFTDTTTLAKDEDTHNALVLFLNGFVFRPVLTLLVAWIIQGLAF
jgi:hypothetical protein